MRNLSTSTAFPGYYYLELLMILMSSGIRRTNAFSIYHSTVFYDDHRVQFLSKKSLSVSLLRDNFDLLNPRIFRLHASTNGRNSQNQPNEDRSYDFIAIEEADKMLQQERLRNEQEIREMKILLERQHEELLEFDSLTSNMQFSNEDYIERIDFIFPEGQDSKCSDDTKRSDINDGKTPFSPPFPTSVDEENYKQKYQRSHNTAEWRTLKISLQQIDEENEDLEKKFDDQQHRYQSDIEDTQRIISAVRDRFDCMQHELKLEILHFERAKADLENMLEHERSKSRELEQKLIVARREQEILEQATIEAKKRQQELQEQEEQEQIERQQRIMQLELEEQEHYQQQQERLHHKDLLRDHEELVELELHQKELDNVYFNLRDDNGLDEKNRNQNESQLEQDPIVVNGEQRPQQYNNSVDLGVSSIYSPQPMQSPHHERTRQEDLQHSFSVAVTAQASEALKPKRDSKRDARKNSHAHGIFMNFNDILV